MGLYLPLQALVLLLERAPRLLQREMGADTRHQLLRLERLGEVVDGAGGERAHLVRGAVQGGQEEYRDVARRLVRLQALAHLEPVQTRHEHIEQHDVEPARADELERFRPARCDRDVRIARAREQPGQGVTVALVVVDDEERGIRSGRHYALSLGGSASPRIRASQTIGNRE